MGYTTDFSGSFKVTPTLSTQNHEFLTKLSQTRRMARKVDAKYGVEGEFYVEGEGYRGQDDDDTVIDFNRPPRTQPSLWCQWIPTEDGTEIVWDEGEKFYEYVAWIEYLIRVILAPRGYKLNGTVYWYGEDRGDNGIIEINDNVVKIKIGTVVYKETN